MAGFKQLGWVCGGGFRLSCNWVSAKKSFRSKVGFFSVGFWLKVGFRWKGFPLKVGFF